MITAGGGGTGSVQNPFLFAGGIQDRATGWVHFGARWYNPTTGRWTQQDTLDNPLDPVNANRYAYAGDDPLNVIDPLGLNATGCAIFTGITAGAGAVAGVAGAIAFFSAPTVAGPAAAGTVAAGAGLVAGIAGLGALLECSVL